MPRDLRNFSAYSPPGTGRRPGTMAPRTADLQERGRAGPAGGVTHRSLPGRCGHAETGSYLGFSGWQVLGSNQRRLSRRFYRHLRNVS
jgi:hypothetical protein